MEENIDEQILLSQRVDENAQEAIVSQVLRIAIYDEFKAYETYTKVMEKFGFIQPFVNIREAESRHYSALIPLLEKYGVEVPINNWAEKIEVPNTLVECYEVGVAAEIRNIAMYDNLISYTNEADIKDVLFRLQAASYNNHLPTFRNCVINHYSAANNQEFNQDDLMQKLGEYQGLFDDLMNGNVDQNKLTEVFSKLNISMISGVGFGAASVALLNTYMNKKDNEE